MSDTDQTTLWTLFKSIDSTYRLSIQHQDSAIRDFLADFEKVTRLRISPEDAVKISNLVEAAQDVLGGTNAFLTEKKRLPLDDESLSTYELVKGIDRWIMRDGSKLVEEAPRPLNVDLRHQTGIPFPSEAHEASFVVPSGTFQGYGSTFIGRRDTISLKGERTGVTAMRDVDSTLVRVLPHSFVVSIQGRMELKIKSSEETNREGQKIAGSIDDTLFSHRAANVFAAQVTKRLGWLQVERASERQPLILRQNRMRPEDGTVRTEEAVPSNEQPLVPWAVECLNLKFGDDVLGRAESIYGGLSSSEQAAYVVPDEGISIGTKEEMTRRINLWKSLDLDRRPEPLRMPAEVKALTSEDALSKRQAAAALAPVRFTKGDKLEQRRAARMKSLAQEQEKQAEKNEGTGTREGQYGLYSFYHPAREQKQTDPPGLSDVKHSMLLKVTFTFKKQTVQDDAPFDPLTVTDRPNEPTYQGTTDDSKWLDNLGISVEASSWGLKPGALLPAYSPPEHTHIVNAIDRAILRLFYKPNADALAAFLDRKTR